MKQAIIDWLTGFFVLFVWGACFVIGLFFMAAAIVAIRYGGGGYVIFLTWVPAFVLFFFTLLYPQTRLIGLSPDTKQKSSVIISYGIWATVIPAFFDGKLPAVIYTTGCIAFLASFLLVIWWKIINKSPIMFFL